MGYEAYTTIEVIHGPDVVDSDHPSHDYFVKVFEHYADMYEYIQESHCNWYSDFEHMELISVKFPDSVFLVTRLGEYGESWKIIAFNGKAQRLEGEIVYPKPDYQALGVAQAYPEYLL